MSNELTDEELARLIQLRDELVQTKAASKGALDEQMKALKKFGCNTLEEAVAEIERLQKKHKRVGKQARDEYDKVMEEFGDRIES